MSKFERMMEQIADPIVESVRDTKSLKALSHSLQQEMGDHDIEECLARIPMLGFDRFLALTGRTMEQVNAEGAREIAARPPWRQTLVDSGAGIPDHRDCTHREETPTCDQAFRQPYCSYDGSWGGIAPEETASRGKHARNKTMVVCKGKSEYNMCTNLETQYVKYNEPSEELKRLAHEIATSVPNQSFGAPTPEDAIMDKYERTPIADPDFTKPLPAEDE